MVRASSPDPIESVPEENALAPALYITATPIGNRGDMTLRALEVLAHADRLLCEDTRVTRKLLGLYGLSRSLTAYHDHNAESMRPRIMDWIAAGQSVALVSDAGTPLISDPGFKLVRACRAAGLAVTALPGASALLSALVVAGLPTDRFLFLGFLPPKSHARRTQLAEIAGVRATVVIYESPRRLAGLLADVADILPGREAAVCRELTKLFEEAVTGKVEDLVRRYAEAETPKGEVVLVIAPPSAEDMAWSDTALDAALIEALKTLSIKDAAATVAAASGASRKGLYARGLALREAED
ncbi:MAG: 16S rRNA (cytidine(1402)-2'-O)-methyltransferase [Rhodospirillaceae bacterium]|nr:16S rRNA (cytidine(1402)-2'-O)-methyltransferase [Rhodospirillaceae bacterium]